MVFTTIQLCTLDSVGHNNVVAILLIASDVILIPNDVS